FGDYSYTPPVGGDVYSSNPGNSVLVPLLHSLGVNAGAHHTHTLGLDPTIDENYSPGDKERSDSERELLLLRVVSLKVLASSRSTISGTGLSTWPHKQPLRKSFRTAANLSNRIWSKMELRAGEDLDDQAGRRSPLQTYPRQVSVRCFLDRNRRFPGVQMAHGRGDRDGPSKLGAWPGQLSGDGGRNRTRYSAKASPVPEAQNKVHDERRRYSLPAFRARTVDTQSVWSLARQ